MTDVVVCVRSINTLADEEPIESISAGTMERQGDTLTLHYEETTEEEVFSTTLTVVDGSRVLLQRHGPLEGYRMTIEQGRRHLCHYETGFGSMTIGIFGEQIRSRVGSMGGKIELTYTMDINAQLSGRNQVEISVRPKETPLQ